MLCVHYISIKLEKNKIKTAADARTKKEKKRSRTTKEKINMVTTSILNSSPNMLPMFYMSQSTGIQPTI